MKLKRIPAALTSRLPAASRNGAIAAAAAAAAAGLAWWVHSKARRAGRDHPPRGRLVDADGTRLHVVEQGSGPAVVLIHGNNVSLEDFQASGLLAQLARTHRVIAVDRPGYGHSPRPRDRLWTPAAQAQAIHAAMQALGVERAAVVGHSMGTLVALSLALDHPEAVERLGLLGGYYFPNMRYDALLTAPVALPVVGDAMRYTVTAVTARMAMKTTVKGMFAPMDIPPHYFDVLHREMLLRPVQLRANAEDAAFMMPAAAGLAKRYGELHMPTAIFAGAEDLVVDPEAHAVRLHGVLAGSTVALVPGCGHMVHYAATERIAQAVTGNGTLLAA